MKLRLAIYVLFLLSLASVALASAPVSVKQYAAMRNKKAAISIRTFKEDPATCAGMIVEIRGKLTGMSKSASGSCLIISTAQDGSFVVTTDDLPAENTGAQLACLVRVGDAAHGLSDLKLVECTYEVELAKAEEAASARPTQAGVNRAKPTATNKGAEQSRATSTALSTDAYVRAYTSAVKRFNCKLTDTQADAIARSVLGFSWRYKVDARLVCAVILAESHFRIGATSCVGAQGLGQLMPSTAAGLGVSDAYDPVQNIYGSVRYIRGMLDRTSGKKHWNDLTWNDLALALAAYNAGPGAVKKHGGVPPFRETRNYVRRVTSIYKQLCGVKD